MAGFETHITVSTVLGLGYGAAGYSLGLAPAESCALAAGLCSLAGMIPDLDSDSGTPVRETMTLTAAVVPMLTMERFREFGWSQELTVVTAAAMYLAIRFGVAELFKRFTVHRGMWHSIPACLIAGLISFMLVSGVNLDIRVYKAVGVMVGFMSHLVLDEIWSFSLKGGRFQIKKSFGTAIKFWGKSRWANFTTYAKLAIVTFLAIGDPVMMQQMGHEMRIGDQSAEVWFQQMQARTAGAQQPSQLQPTQFPQEDWRR